MSLDPKIGEAIQVAVENAGQTPTLAQRLMAWLEAITSGNEDIKDQDSAERHLELLYKETVVEHEKEEDC